MVKGRLTPDPETGSPRLWERRDGNPAASYEVTAHEIVYLNGREAGSSVETPESVVGTINEDIPF